MKTNDLGKDSIPLLVCKLAVPSMIAQLVTVLYSIIDRMYIGNIPLIGDIALAGVGVCGPIVTLLTSFGTLIGLGGSILMAMRMGAGKKEEASQILSNSFFLLTAFSILLTILFLLGKDKLLMWFGASAITFPYANTYMTIYTIGTFFALMAIGLNYFITSQGFATYGMVTVLIGAVTNIILDFIFIFLCHWGIAGAALATVISQILSSLFAFVFLLRKKVPIYLTFGKYSWSKMKNIISFGLSPFLILATDSIIIIAMNTALQYFGGEANGDLYISCATIMQSYLMLITGPMIGITGGTQAIISYNYGACYTKRVKEAIRSILLLCVSFTIIMFFISRLVPQYFVLLFTSEPEYMKLSIWGIQTITLAIIPLAFQYVFVDGLTAMGHTKTALSLSIFRKSLYVISLFVLPLFFTAKHIFFAQPLSDLAAASLSTIVFFIVFPKYLRLLNKKYK